MEMKNKILAITAIGFLALSFTVSVLAGETHQKTLVDFLNENSFLKNANVQITGSTSVYSKYLWRGFRLDDDYVIQPSVNIAAFQGWNLNVWGNYDISHDINGTNSNETDTTLTYTKKFENLKLLGMGLKPVSVTVGHIYYDFSGTGLFAKESVLGVGYETFLSPTLTWYHDYSRESQGGGRGDYLMLCANKSIDLIKNYGVTLDLSGHVGYNKHDYILGEGGDVLLTGGVTVPLTKNLKLSPTVNWNLPFGGVSEDGNGNQKNEFFWGSTLAYNF